MQVTYEILILSFDIQEYGVLSRDFIMMGFIDKERDKSGNKLQLDSTILSVK